MTVGMMGSLSGGRTLISETGGRENDTLTHQDSVLPLHKPPDCVIPLFVILHIPHFHIKWLPPPSQ